MYKPTRQWQRLEKVLLFQRVNGLEESDYVNLVLRIAKIKNSKPWIVAEKYPTLNWFCCHSKFSKDSDWYCSCESGVHENLYFTAGVLNESLEESWDA